MQSLDSLLVAESFFITLSVILILCPIAIKIGLTDQPCSRKRHAGEIPLIGGVSIYLCLIFLYAWLPITNNVYLVAVTIIVISGIIDDYKPIGFRKRLFAEAIAILIMIKFGGLEITHLGNLLGFGDIQLGNFSTIFTVFAVVGGINAFNMVDGIDGLAGSLSLMLFILLLSITFNTPQISALCLFYIPAIIAFLIFNMRVFGRKKASIFLGDTGSKLFGFTICWLLILASQGENKIVSPVTVLWILAFPLLDAVSIMIRRIRKGRSVFAPDREHFHHILPLAGYTVNQTIIVVLIFSLSLGCLGILGEIYFKLPEWLLFYLFLSLFSTYYWGMNHAWKVMKFARFQRAYKNDRRQIDRREKDLPFKGRDRRILSERRSGIDRRQVVSVQ